MPWNLETWSLMSVAILPLAQLGKITEFSQINYKLSKSLSNTAPVSGYTSTRSNARSISAVKAINVHAHPTTDVSK